MREGDQQNITYRTQRYQSKERELEITLDTEDRRKAIVEEKDMVEPNNRGGGS